MSFARRLGAAIRASGKTQKAIAAEAGLSEGVISMYLRRGTEPRRPAFERLCAIFPELRDPANEAIAS